MTEISNKCLDNFKTNKDPEVGKAIAEAASLLSKKIKPGVDLDDTKVVSRAPSEMPAGSGRHCHCLCCQPEAERSSQ
ncbi:MAG TPA: hypothetical protein V6C72_17680 [Chroococcales cyanobacterium]